MKRSAFLTTSVAIITAVSLSGVITSCAPPVASSTEDQSFGVSGDVQVGEYKSADELVNAVDTAQFCGDKPLTIGHPLPVGVSWLKTVNALLTKEVKAKCPNVTLVFTDAQGDPQKAASDINSLVAQGVDGLLVDPVFGATLTPALRSAKEAGVPVVTYVSDGGAVAGQDITANAPVYQVHNGELWTDFLDRALKGQGTVVFLGGAPGQPSSLANLEAIKTSLKNHPGLKLIEEDMQSVNNDAAQARQVTSGLLAKHGRIDAVITDNGTISAPVIEAYEAAGFKPPALAVSAASNGLNCAWTSRRNFPYFTTDGNQMVSLVGLRTLLGEINGVETTEPQAIASWTMADTVAGVEPICHEDASPDADWSTSLTEAEMKALF